jgi:hypothetical protein
VTPDEFRAEVRRRVDAEHAGKIARAAEAWRIDRPSLSAYLSGRKPVRPRLLAALGYEWAIVPIDTGR